MKKEIKPSNILFYSIAALVVLSAIYLLCPAEDVSYAFKLKKYCYKIISHQNIAPSRLFVNSLRVIRNEYYDKTCNGQNLSKWKLRYTGKIKTQDDAELAINTVLASLNDNYSRFLRKNKFSKEKNIIESKVSGIGILFDNNEHGAVINNVLSKSPAKNAGIMPGDKIVSLNKISPSDEKFNDLLTDISSGEKHNISIVVERNGELIKKELKSKDILFDTMEYKINKNGIAIVNIYSLTGRKSVEKFKKILEKTNDAKGVIFDLRNNYGGIPANAILMADMIVESGKLIIISGSGNKKLEVYADEGKIYKDKPTVVLINEHSASAAEIFAGIMKYNYGAVIIGENSFGKNTIQQVIPMHCKSGLILTTDKYYFSDNIDISQTGIIPDIVVPRDESFGSDNQLKKAEEIVLDMAKNKG